MVLADPNPVTVADQEVLRREARGRLGTLVVGSIAPAALAQ